MTLTLSQLKKLAELNMDEKHYQIYLCIIEPNIKSMLDDYLKGWQNLETLVTRMTLRAKNAYKGKMEIIFSDDDDLKKYDEHIDVSIYYRVKKLGFDKKIKFLNKRGIIGNSVYQLLDFLRKRRNKIHSYEPAFSETEREAFVIANSIVTWISALNSDSGFADLKEKNRILQMCENQSLDLLNKLKEIVSNPNQNNIADERPTIPRGKSDRYYMCNFCGHNVSVQFKNCPNCRTPNPKVETL